MKLSICIVSYNTRDWLARCLTSIEQHAGKITHEVIVVENGSADGSADMVRAQFPDVKLIVPGCNTFYSAGNNLAVEAAQGEYALILNPDTELWPGTLAALIDALEASPERSLVTARQVWTDGTTTLRIGSRFATYADLWLDYTPLGALLPGWRSRRRARMWYADWDRLTDRAIEVAPGSCLLGRRELLARLGPFDERLPLYFSDDDLCRRVLAEGRTVWYAADAVITHAESASMDQDRRIKSRATFADLAVYARLWYGPLRARLLMMASAPLRWLMTRRG